MPSVIRVGFLPAKTCFSHTWQHPAVSCFFQTDHPEIIIVGRNGVLQPVSGIPPPEIVVPMSGLVFIVFTRGRTVSAMLIILEHGS